ncbi:uncharacterized protein LOC9647225 isoform X1 [Selaginella moellendorffii]|uniref:uncharacterized protein LOC9647225 isoform X1 n=1 Tax=Selaginella moellendorffii TaxID=88036 RepID=UPI000D1C6120|nr:uncharacterized protein LOC9647225 isoform X1 [Selaginella moellendorffii]XP_024542145.1 uncharacterized protein LOC9647225 isoform X1 [Selaginella moellendorffii]XP_024542146.1 uncharacterized protein LOC9647225 isoform X1 [Selaginella moellendorffii]|eukprot:XP_024542144.1 uncharacterized protein LOC9647225 isoform X1 [Selaginella moellendorffii]
MESPRDTKPPCFTVFAWRGRELQQHALNGWRPPVELQGPWCFMIITLLCMIILFDNVNKYAPYGFLAPVIYAGTDNATSEIHSDDNRVRILLDLWSKTLDQGARAAGSDIPAPHFQDCKKSSEDFTRLDSRQHDGRRPLWTLWKGALGLELGGGLSVEDDGEEMLSTKARLQGPYPPWIQGGDEDNLPLTRRAQRDIWLNQHPRNCSSAKFLLADWESQKTRSSIGVGAELVAMTGLLAVALREGRVLVTKDYHGANHSGCTGSSHSRWSCYFAAEASNECIDRALKLSMLKSAWREGILTSSKNYPPFIVWKEVPVPTTWGRPWESIQRTVELDGSLLSGYKAQDRRWWRTQALRYLMRSPSENLCNLLNRARHDAFGVKAAEIALDLVPREWPKVQYAQPERTPIEKLVWSSLGPWIPRPLVSMHVRQGDKGSEMRVFAFPEYMKLAEHLKRAFPHVRGIWLSTEMENVVEESRSYTDWNFYFTNITRQSGSTSMAAYMAQLGKRRNFDNAFVNLLMAAESDFFIGALGSTWSCIIDGLRMTSGKTMSGFLTVNPINELL